MFVDLPIYPHPEYPHPYDAFALSKVFLQALIFRPSSNGDPLRFLPDSFGAASTVSLRTVPAYFLLYPRDCLLSPAASALDV